ncbi:hypothetical protein ACX84Z_16630, partial [Burkholderia pseudomallei]
MPRGPGRHGGEHRAPSRKARRLAEISHAPSIHVGALMRVDPSGRSRFGGARRTSVGRRSHRQATLARAIPVRERERIDVPNTPKRPVRARNGRLARGNRRRR